MVATLESPRSTGQTLLFPSPTHLHHPDATSATIRSIRRSLSRSPSKAPAFRLISSTSPSPSSRSPLTASPVSPSSAPETARTPTTVKPPSPLAVPFPPSAKLQRASVRKPYVGRASTRSKTSPADLARCPLGLSRDQGNARPRSPPIAKPTGSARETRSASPADRLSRGQGFPTVGVHLADDKGSVPTQNGFQADKAIQMNAGGSSGTSSPLKRTDGIMDLDQTSLGSPVAKRRSMHSGFFGADFNVFDHASTSARPSDQPNERSRAFDPSGGRGLLPGGTSPFFASMPKRSSSLRKSTLQQRYTDKPIFAQSRPNSDLAFEFASNGAQEPRHRHHRMSLDNFVPSMARESPFTSTGSLPSASIHNLPHGNAAPQAGAKQGQVHRHPLSQAISQSSSASSLAEESPTHVPSHQHEHPGPTIAFSKSLPMGGVRPIFKRPMSSDGPNQAASSTGPTYVTPQHYRLVKPLPAAFMSTGLISKRNRNPEELLPGGGGNKAAMPDTPCKRPALSFDAVPFSGRKSIATSPLPSGYEDDVPTTPLHLHQSKLATGSVGTGVGIFGTKFVDGSATRRSSFLSIDGDDNSHSPSGRGEDQQSEYELPPTPTKQVYSLGGTPMAKPNNEPGSIIGNMSFSKAVGSFSTLPVGLQSSREARSSSPIDHLDFAERSSPHTPQESMLPPDPSGLSISGHASAPGTGVQIHLRKGTSMFPPATPTAGRDGQSQHPGRITSVTPIGGFATNDVDASLTSRFDRVELIGTGEFSQVYRVTQAAEPRRPRSRHSDSSARVSYSSAQSLTDQVFAVKKSRHPYAGNRDRRRKLQEVNVLKALGHSDHVVHLIDDWEDKNYLYIQTEFCEEGSLDMFLTQVGRKARLDDFRIWKIMLELGLGIKHVHESGFIHLDLKPANVLITFEGVLKIGDFGMAARWPAEAGIEGEGDREYIGPEILMGLFDKPADIFALGLIMLEIAGNVELPDNGPSWQKLRAGDMSDVPSLTWSSGSNVFRDSSGNPVSDGESFGESYESDWTGEEFSSSDVPAQRIGGRRSDDYLKLHSSSLCRDGELRQPPNFMADPHHEHALDRIVRWMISPNPQDRPVVDEILRVAGVKWVESRRRAGAIVFEGNWGPADDVLGCGVDSDMVDV